VQNLLRILYHLSRFSLAALFLFAVGAKLYTLKDPVNGLLTNLPALVGKRWAVPVFVAVLAAELLAAVLLLLPRAARAGAVWAGLLLTGFAGYALYYVYVLKGEALECGCFGGIIASQLGVKTALRNLLLLIPCLLVIIIPHLRAKSLYSELKHDR
jgi:hypothetical protein